MKYHCNLQKKRPSQILSFGTKNYSLFLSICTGLIRSQEHKNHLQTSKFWWTRHAPSIVPHMLALGLHGILSIKFTAKEIHTARKMFLMRQD